MCEAFQLRKDSFRLNLSLISLIRTIGFQQVPAGGLWGSGYKAYFGFGADDYGDGDMEMERDMERLCLVCGEHVSWLL